MGAVEERADRLAQLIGRWDDVVTLPPARLRLLFRRVVEHEDKTLLEALYACVAHDFRLIPSTPVWILGSLNDFELAAVYDRLVLFKETRFWRAIYPCVDGIRGLHSSETMVAMGYGELVSPW